MRVTISVVDSEEPVIQVNLAGAPASGDVINLNGLTYRVEQVHWNANPAPMRADDLFLIVREEDPS